MNETTNKNMNEIIYLRVRKAKADVESFIEFYGEITDHTDFFKKAIESLSPDARQVLGAGILFNNDDIGYQFAMPKTSDVGKFLGKKSKFYERGYSKMTVMESRVDEPISKTTLRKSNLVRYEVFAEEEKKEFWKDLLGVQDIIAGNDYDEATTLADEISVVFDKHIEDAGSISIAEIEDELSISIRNEGTSDEEAKSYGWNSTPVISARKSRNGSEYMITLPPCVRIK